MHFKSNPSVSSRNVERTNLESNQEKRQLESSKLEQTQHSLNAAIQHIQEVMLSGFVETSRDAIIDTLKGSFGDAVLHLQRVPTVSYLDVDTRSIQQRVFEMLSDVMEIRFGSQEETESTKLAQMFEEVLASLLTHLKHTIAWISIAFEQHTASHVG